MKIVIHDVGVAEAMTALSVDAFPGVRLFDARDLAPVEDSLLARWQAEDLVAAEDMRALGVLALAWLTGEVA